jgi:hypothetical protein
VNPSSLAAADQVRLDLSRRDTSPVVQFHPDVGLAELAKMHRMLILRRTAADLHFRRRADLNIHLAPELTQFAAENKEWLRICRLPAYAPDLNPAERIWSLKRSIANFAAADLNGLTRIVKRKLKKIQYRAAC